MSLTPHKRVARRLEPDEFRLALGDRALQRVKVFGVDEIDPEAEIGRFVREPGAERPVHNARRNDARARTEAEEERHRRRHARAEDERRLGAFERPDHRFRLAHRRIVRPAVDVARTVEIVGIADEGRATWIGGTSARVVSSILPSAWAARVRALQSPLIAPGRAGASARPRAAPPASAIRRSLSEGARSTRRRPRSRRKRSGARSLEKRRFITSMPMPLAAMSNRRAR